MGMNSLLDAAGPLVEAQILRDFAEDFEGEDREKFLKAARELEAQHRRQQRLEKLIRTRNPNPHTSHRDRRNGVAPLNGLATSSPGADSPLSYPGDDFASSGGEQ